MAEEKVPIKIVQTDLSGDCVRLNRRFELVETRVAQAQSQAASAVSAASSDVGTPGTYKEVTVDAQGRVTSGSTPPYPPTQQAVVTSSRALGTVYHNSGKTPMFVVVTLLCTASGGSNFGEAHAFADSATSPTTVVGRTFNGSSSASVAEQLSFFVLPGNYYKVAVVTTTVVLTYWVEWH